LGLLKGPRVLLRDRDFVLLGLRWARTGKQLASQLLTSEWPADGPTRTPPQPWGLFFVGGGDERLEVNVSVDLCESVALASSGGPLADGSFRPFSASRACQRQLQ